ncbi:MAG: ATP-binding protein [Kiritimatiellia bacterium]|nr:response regulator [Lentisphaerota bacterium]
MNKSNFAQTMRIEIPAESSAPITRRMPAMHPRPFTARPNLPVTKLLGEAEYTLYHEFMQSIYDAVVITEINGNIMDGNIRAFDFFLYELEDLRRVTIFDIVCGFNKFVLETIKHNLENERFTLIEAYCRRSNGTIFPCEIATSRLHLGQKFHFCFFVRDITKRKQDEADLISTRAQLERAERLEMAGSIAGHIAHDFNNLLTPLLAYPAFIREALPEDSPARQDLEIIEKTAQQIADINQQLLALSRRGYCEQQALHINNIVEDIVALIQRGSHLENITIELDLAQDLLNIKGSSEQLLRVIHNLCQNAIDAMGNQGSLVISTQAVYLEKPLKKYESVAQGEYVKLTITDTGHGIPPEIQDKIFDPFFTTKQATRQRGSGLGLSVVHGIVKDHNGYIDMESAPGKGTSFSLYFPICREAVTEKSQKGYPTGTETIMVVDDDPLQIEVTSRILNKLGYTVISANSGEKALAQLDLPDAPSPSLVLLDMIMGSGIDGTETFRQLKKRNPRQRAIILSGYSESARVAAAQALGAGSYLRKPVSLEKLAQAVRQELDRPD